MKNKPTKKATAKAKTKTKRSYVKLATIVPRVLSTMKRRSSRTTGNVSIGRTEIADYLGLPERTVDRAIHVLKTNKTIWRNGHRYTINLKK